ncbi:uncharacterized protein LOC141857290 [Brevipalpus obovatus]|uniref:uncharacterized protein LOC141857290 n=1 Tax=Brevipalpus obovatus TaxID=246614 RepID=UPI003D9E2243
MKFASGDGSSSKSSSSKNITTNRFSANYDPPIFNRKLDQTSEEEELNLATPVDIADIKLRSKSIQEVTSSQSTVNSISSSRLSLQQPIRSESNCSSVGRFSNSSSGTSQRHGLGSKSILSVPSTVTGTSGSLTSITAAAMSCPSGDDSCAINELLEGRMSLSVILPPELMQAALNSSKIRNGSKSDIKSAAIEKNGNTVCINVDRKTPMMDILVNIATQFRFNASKYRLSVDGHDFKASTPIGSLDVNQVSIVPKVNKIYGVNSRHSWFAGSSECGGIGISSGGLVDSSSAGSNGNTGSICALNVPFQTTFRLQVNLPRNQLMVLRVSPNLTIAQVKSAICEKKELDGSKYHLTATEGRLLKLLDLDRPLSYYGVHEVNLISDRVLSELQHQMDTTSSTTSTSINGHRDGGSSSGNRVARHPSNANSNGSAHSSSVNGKNIQPLASATNCSTSDTNGKSRIIINQKTSCSSATIEKSINYYNSFRNFICESVCNIDSLINRFFFKFIRSE